MASVQKIAAGIDTILMNNFSFNNEHCLQKHGTGEPGWYLHMPIYSWVNSSNRAIENSSLKPFVQFHATLQPQEQKSAKTDRTPFVTSFNPALPKISSIINKYTSLLQATANCKKAFPNPPVIAYRHTRRKPT